MSFVDLATLALYRRNEMEARINTFIAKCDHAVNHIETLKAQAQGFVQQLNCEQSELKDRFLTCMKQLDEYIYLITDFNLSVGKLEETESMENTPTPVQDVSTSLLPVLISPFNVIDTLSEPAPSTSTACANNCSLENIKYKKLSKEEQVLILFSSASCSSESVPMAKKTTIEVETQCDLTNEIQDIKHSDSTSSGLDSCRLPAQTMLQTDHVYPAIIMNIDGVSFWMITDDITDLYSMVTEMTNYYKKNHVDMTSEDVMKLSYCAIYDPETDCYYRGLFIGLSEDDDKKMMKDDDMMVFLVDTGEIRSIDLLKYIQPLVPQFCIVPPFARCCHLAGVDLLNFYNKDLIEKQDKFMKQFMYYNCSIEIDDNTSEFLEVYVILPNKETLNELLVKEGMAFETTPAEGAAAAAIADPSHGPPELPELSDSALDIGDCPEYEDPVEAVTGYKCRDDADICKHYKGNPEKTCFKGSRCNKKHILKHPDGWTLDKVEVVAKCHTYPLPAPGTWHKVLVTCVTHFDRLYVQFVKEKEPAELPDFGVMLPPASLDALVSDMNSPATRISYKPLAMAPAPGEFVAALYPPDDQWYRARVVSTTRADQNVEVMYVDYGNVLYVKEDYIRVLEPRYMVLPMQAVRCTIAGVVAITHDSRQWAEANKHLTGMIQNRTLDAHIIARDYDELTIELFDKEGYSVAEEMAVQKLVDLKSFEVIDDTKVTQTQVVP